jgi:hypothetical protein
MKRGLSPNEIILVVSVIVGCLVGMIHWGHDIFTDRIGGLEGAAIGLGIYAVIVGMISLFRREKP